MGERYIDPRELGIEIPEPETEGTPEAPKTVEGVLSQIQELKNELKGRVYTALAKFRTGRAEGKFNDPYDSDKGPLDERSNRFQALGQKTKWKLDRLHSPDHISYHGEDQWILKRYEQKADKLKTSIRKENIAAYLALRKARESAKTPEQTEQLAQLLKRQNELRKILLQPEFSDHMGALADILQTENDEYQRRIDMIRGAKKNSAPDMTLYAKGEFSPLEIGILEEIRRNVELDDCNEVIHDNKETLEAIEEYQKRKNSPLDSK